MVYLLIYLRFGLFVVYLYLYIYIPITVLCLLLPLYITISIFVQNIVPSSQSLQTYLICYVLPYFTFAYMLTLSASPEKSHRSHA